MKSDIVRILLIGATVVSLVTLGVGSATAATPESGTATAVSGDSVVDVEGTDCTGTVCEASCAAAGVLEKAKIDAECPAASGSGAGTATVSLEDPNCVECPVRCAGEVAGEVLDADKERPGLACPR